jgi:hypothetical protein
MSVRQCPPNYRPGCSCSGWADEPDEDCWQHGFPDVRLCPFCGRFRSLYRPCKRCGCTYGVDATNRKPRGEEASS